MNPSIQIRRLSAAIVVALCLTPVAHADTPAQLLNQYSAQAGVRPNPEQGRLFFNASHGRDWRCASCHGEVPTQTGKHASTGKPIGPMAPAFNPARFTDADKVEKWFRRNCNDVAGRACTAAEKADVLSWLLTLKT